MQLLMFLRSFFENDGGFEVKKKSRVNVDITCYIFYNQDNGDVLLPVAKITYKLTSAHGLEVPSIVTD